jgi:hypothetical protein
MSENEAVNVPTTSAPAGGAGAVTTRRRTWEACAALHEAQSPLAQLDSRVVFGNDYPEPIRYDAERKLLRYRGFMPHASYVKLAALSDDRAYQTALERLFVATSPAAESPPWPIPWKGIAAAIVIAALLCGWYVRGSRVQRAAVPEPAEERVVTLKVESSGDLAVQLPQTATDRPAGEARRPIER